MSLVRIGTALALACSLSGCQTALWGNVCAFVISVGIFMGTLSLGRQR